MTMRVVLPSEVYRKETIVGTIFGPPGLRKTTLAFTTDRPLLLDFDGGVHRAEFRRAFVPIETWDDVLGMEKADFDGYRTAVVDTAGRAIEALGQKIITQDPKNANKSGGLSLQGFGVLKTQFASWLWKLRSYGLNVLLVLHTVEDQRGGDNTVIRIDAQGGSKQEIYKVSDFMGLIDIDHEGCITLNLSPSDVAFGKNPAWLPLQRFKTIDASSTHMAKIFSATLEKINAMSEEQREVSAALEAWRDRVMAATTAEELTDLIDEVPADPRVTANAKKVLNSIAIDKGFIYDKAQEGFVARPANVAQFPASAAQQAPAGAPPAQEAPKGQSPAAEASQPAQGAPAAEGTASSGYDGGAEAAHAALREPGDEGPDGPLATREDSPAAEKRKRLGELFAGKYPAPSALIKAFRAADATVFFNGKLKGTRQSPTELSDMDVAIMLHAIDTKQLSI